MGGLMDRLPRLRTLLNKAAKKKEERDEHLFAVSVFELAFRTTREAAQDAQALHTFMRDFQEGRTVYEESDRIALQSNNVTDEMRMTISLRRATLNSIKLALPTLQEEGIETIIDRFKMARS
jgi:hypothetical protein